MKLRLILDVEVHEDHPSTKTNHIANGIIEIARLPPLGQKVKGAKVGNRVPAKIVLQYCGPIKLQILKHEQITKPKPKKKKVIKRQAKRLYLEPK